MPGPDGRAAKQFLCRSVGLAYHPRVFYFAGRAGRSVRGARSASGPDEYGSGKRDAAGPRKGSAHAGASVGILVFRQLRLHLIDISDDPAFQIVKIGEPEFLFQLPDGFGAAGTSLAVHDHFAIPADPVAIGRHGCKRYQLPADIDDIVFMRLAHIYQLERLAFYLQVVQLFYRYLLERTLFYGAHAAKLLVIDQRRDGRVFPVERVVFPRADGERPALEIQRIENIKTPGQRFASAGDDLDDLQRLETADDPR